MHHCMHCPHSNIDLHNDPSKFPSSLVLLGFAAVTGEARSYGAGAFAIREHGRRSEVSAWLSGAGKLELTDAPRSAQTVAERIPEGFRSAKRERNERHRFQGLH